MNSIFVLSFALLACNAAALRLPQHSDSVSLARATDMNPDLFASLSLAVAEPFPDWMPGPNLELSQNPDGSDLNWDEEEDGSTKPGYAGPNWARVSVKKAKIMQALRNQTIIMYGDSFVQHWGSGGREHKYWQTMIQDRYGPSHASGIRGDTIPYVLHRLENGASPEPAHPKVIMLHIGTNDIARAQQHKVESQYVGAGVSLGLKKIIKNLIEASPDSKIVLSGVFPRLQGEPGEWGAQNTWWESTVTEVNKQMEGLADNSKIYFSNCGHVLLNWFGRLDPEAVKGDTMGIHPAGKASEKWAECLWKTLDPILPKIA